MKAESTFLRVLAGLVFVLSASMAHATEITIDFSFTVDSIVLDLGGLWASNGVSVGSTYTGSFVYDDAATNINDNDSNSDIFDFISFTSTFPGAATTPLRIGATDFGATDEWQLNARYTLPGSVGPDSITFLAQGDFGYNQGSPIDVGVGLGHPILGPPITALSASIDYQFEGSNRGELSASVTLSTRQVPEPTTLALLGIGLAGMGFARRRVKA